MLDPYRMVAVNIISSTILVAGLLFYKFIFPKRKINLFFLLILISILPVISILRIGDYESGDFNIHIYRIMSFYDSLKEGIFMPSWAAELNATYGNPLFIFNYSLPYYLISLLHFIGFSFISSMKIFLGSSLFLSGVFMYLWIKKLTGNNLAAFTAGIFYIFNPYHLIDVHFRATPGESSVFTLAPLVLLFITNYFKEKKFNYLILVGLLTILMSLGHPLQAIAILGITISYTIFMGLMNKDKISLLRIIGSLLLGCIASIHLWLPFALYAPFTFHIQSANNNIYFPPFNFLFFSPWRYGFLFQGPKGELALMIGYTQTLIVITSIPLLIKGKIIRKIRLYYLFWIAMFIFTLLLMHPSSQIFWNFFLILGQMLVPFGRLLLPVALISSVIAAYFTIVFCTSRFKKIFMYAILTITVLSTILNWGHRRVIPEINDEVLRKNVWKSTVTEGKTAYFLNNKWADPNNFWFSELPQKHLEIIEGKGTIQELKRTSIKHLYIINAQTPIIIRENTLYFPGWTLNSNSKQIHIYPGKRGVIYAKLPQGLHHLKLAYEDVPTYKLSKMVGGGIFLSLIMILSINLFLGFFPSKPQHFSRHR